MMYGLLEERKENILTLSDITLPFKHSGNYIVPDDRDEIAELLDSLHSTGLISVLKSEDKVWVVVNKGVLLTKVDGILFAPKTFKEYVDVASNTGIVSVSGLTRLFPNYDPDMLICFLKNMQLCQELDPSFLKMTNLTAEDRDETGDSASETQRREERLLFFPCLLSTDRPKEMTSQVYQFGWCLHCTRENDFFLPRYFHVLSLRLAFKFSFSKGKELAEKLNRECKFWSNGIHWFDGYGVKVLVEIVDESQCVLVMMSCEKGDSKNMVSLRKNVIREVMNVYKESCPSLKVEELIIDPEELAYPVNRLRKKTVYGVFNLLSAIISKKRRYLVCDKRQKKLKEILPDESLILADISELSLLGGRDIKEVLGDSYINQDHNQQEQTETNQKDESATNHSSTQTTQTSESNDDQQKEPTTPKDKNYPLTQITSESNDDEHKEPTTPKDKNQTSESNDDEQKEPTIQEVKPTTIDSPTQISESNDDQQKVILTIDDLVEILRVLKSGHFQTTNWSDLGLYLGLTHDELDVIEADYPQNAKRCLRECLAKWLKTDFKATWDNLVHALIEAGEASAAAYITSGAAGVKTNSQFPIVPDHSDDKTTNESGNYTDMNYPESEMPQKIEEPGIQEVKPTTIDSPTQISESNDDQQKEPTTPKDKTDLPTQTTSESNDDEHKEPGIQDVKQTTNDSPTQTSESNDDQQKEPTSPKDKNYPLTQTTSESNDDEQKASGAAGIETNSQFPIVPDHSDDETTNESGNNTDMNYPESEKPQKIEEPGIQEVKPTTNDSPSQISESNDDQQKEPTIPEDKNHSATEISESNDDQQKEPTTPEDSSTQISEFNDDQQKEPTTPRDKTYPPTQTTSESNDDEHKEPTTPKDKNQTSESNDDEQKEPGIQEVKPTTNDSPTQISESNDDQQKEPITAMDKNQTSESDDDEQREPGIQEVKPTTIDSPTQISESNDDQQKEPTTPKDKNYSPTETSESNDDQQKASDAAGIETNSQFPIVPDHSDDKTTNESGNNTDTNYPKSEMPQKIEEPGIQEVKPTTNDSPTQISESNDNQQKGPTNPEDKNYPPTQTTSESNDDEQKEPGIQEVKPTTNDSPTQINESNDDQQKEPTTPEDTSTQTTSESNDDQHEEPAIPKDKTYPLTQTSESNDDEQKEPGIQEVKPTTNDSPTQTSESNDDHKKEPTTPKDKNYPPTQTTSESNDDQHKESGIQEVKPTTNDSPTQISESNDDQQKEPTTPKDKNYSPTETSESNDDQQKASGAAGVKTDSQFPIVPDHSDDKTTNESGNNTDMNYPESEMPQKIEEPGIQEVKPTTNDSPTQISESNDDQQKEPTNPEDKNYPPTQTTSESNDDEQKEPGIQEVKPTTNDSPTQISESNDDQQKEPTTQKDSSTQTSESNDDEQKEPITAQDKNQTSESNDDEQREPGIQEVKPITNDSPTQISESNDDQQKEPTTPEDTSTQTTSESNDDQQKEPTTPKNKTYPLTQTSESNDDEQKEPGIQEVKPTTNDSPTQISESNDDQQKEPTAPKDKNYPPTQTTSETNDDEHKEPGIQKVKPTTNDSSTQISESNDDQQKEPTTPKDKNYLPTQTTSESNDQQKEPGIQEMKPTTNDSPTQISESNDDQQKEPTTPEDSSTQTSEFKDDQQKEPITPKDKNYPPTQATSESDDDEHKEPGIQKVKVKPATNDSPTQISESNDDQQKEPTIPEDKNHSATEISESNDDEQKEPTTPKDKNYPPTQTTSESNDDQHKEPTIQEVKSASIDSPTQISESNDDQQKASGAAGIKTNSQFPIVPDHSDDKTNESGNNTDTNHPESERPQKIKGATKSTTVELTSQKIDKKIASHVLAENISSIIKCCKEFELTELAEKFMEMHIITREEMEDLVKNIKKNSRRMNIYQMKQLLKQLERAVSFRGEIFSWFLKILEDYDTEASQEVARKLEADYEKMCPSKP
ncbi:PREDICTED: WASH complex subunit FAM21 homolog [Amphimedon queenslandica]|uniref:Death domain-containing protein n=2 Tax=Amphimedon queenslandica TaxID=400682 RepID=A0AAN0JA49_AMPQE|nr:PREDICTED: WASH complex subunit FAM21 homolog [Amphimedon queenslandica]|eukprot:XP_019853915.1 PREDICTED: WASH complex subunit FAM21 homolog [Amphimedon queenslandica]